MKALKTIKPQDLAGTKSQGKGKSDAKSDYTTNTGGDPRYVNAFTKLLDDLRDKVLAAKDHKIWQSETVFITIEESNVMCPTIRAGALIWVDTAQKPKPSGGIVEGDMYMLETKVRTKKGSMSWTDLKRVCIWYKDGIWGREYFTDCENKITAPPRYAVPFRNQKEHVEDNKRYVGRVIGTLNPV